MPAGEPPALRELFQEFLRGDQVRSVEAFGEPLIALSQLAQRFCIATVTVFETTEASAASKLNLRVDGGELTAGVVDFHLPVDAALGRVHVG